MNQEGAKPMNEETFQRKLGELIAEIATLPAGERDKLEMLATATGFESRIVDHGA